jgi:carotenoid cleavage dioxygenase
MDRREWLQQAGAWTVSTLGATAPWAALANPPTHADWPRELTPFRGLRGNDLDCPALEVEGRVPADLAGTLFRNGPALFERNGERYRHWFDGDGMVQAFRFDNGRIAHRGRFVRTRKFDAEQKAGRFQFATFGTPIRGRVPVRTPDEVNAANTSVVPHGGRLLALWEAGSATELDPASLATRGPVTWRDDLKALPFTAHPKIGADGTMWAFGALPGMPMIALYEIGRDGRLRRFATVPAPGISMLHDFLVTERHLVFVFPALTFDAARARDTGVFTDGFVERADAPQRVLTVAKSDLATTRWYELPHGFVFHLGNAWEETSGQIRFDMVVHPDATGMTEAMPRLMRGEPYASPPSQIAFVTLDPAAGTARWQLAPFEAEFPRVDPRRVGLRHRQLYVPYRERSAGSPFGLNAVLRVDAERGRLDRYAFGPRFIVEEQVVVPRRGTADEGAAWLLGTGFDIARQVSFVSVFDATNVASGPVAIARLPYWLPLTFHGNFAAA